MHSPFEFPRLQTPCLMGIINVTPNSFSDGGVHLPPDAAIEHGRLLAKVGAQILDLGAEASSFFRPGVAPVDPTEQLRRLLPVIPPLAEMSETAGVYLSIDTRSAAVARETLHAGAHIINDISAATYDPDMLRIVAETGAAIILMHIGPAFPAVVTTDDPDIINSVRHYLKERIAAAEHAGIPRNRMAIDPGVGFGKSSADNWRLALRCHEFSDLGVPVVLGASRKRFLETEPPDDVRPHGWSDFVRRMPSGVHPRDAATTALSATAAGRGVAIHRVHDVTLTRRALKM
ncbi:MAG TPA: dihydropteroate synthase [Phycisphaerae bacterium]|nr:dihydropteroate synthase [Phycisphaerae bacterium]